YASDQQFAPTCQDIRLCSAALGTGSWCRFLGTVLQRQLLELGVQCFHVHRGFARSVATASTKYLGRRFLKLGLPSRDLLRVHVEMLSQLSQRHLALDRG
ncbi:hypothetical protein ABIB99_008884, partial [Bradyrhizobium sp. LA6.1]